MLQGSHSKYEALCSSDPSRKASAVALSLRQGKQDSRVGHEWWTSSFRRQMMTSGRSRECCSARARSVMWWLTLEAAEPGPPQ